MVVRYQSLLASSSAEAVSAQWDSREEERQGVEVPVNSGVDVFTTDIVVMGEICTAVGQTAPTSSITIQASILSTHPVPVFLFSSLRGKRPPRLPLGEAGVSSGGGLVSEGSAFTC